MERYLIGVDEAGRGPLAGPVAVGIVVAPSDFEIREAFPGVADSKVLSPEKREELFMLLQRKSAEMPSLRYIVVFSSAKVIDEKGITRAVRHSIYRGMRLLAPDPLSHEILLDGLLHAPPEFSQRTIIRGDASEPIISLASIVAKVTRDRLMRRYAKTYPDYGFEAHKGYATKRHYAAIEKLGICALHRTTYRLR